MTIAAGATILMAEDDDNDVFFLERAFKQAQITNPRQRVEDGEEAIAYLRGDGEYSDRRKFPLPYFMLLDLKLPRKNGFEVLAWARQQPHIKRLPIAVLTSSKAAPDINRAYDAGANTYLVKPVNFEDLLETIRSLNRFWLSLAKMPDLIE
jgi:DNA-binding response OmpR family regulator